MSDLKSWFRRSESRGHVGESGHNSRWRTLGLVSLLTLTLATGAGVERFVLADTVLGGQRHEDFEDLEAYDTLVEAYDLIRDNYVLNDEVSDEDLIYGATTGMMASLNDAGHSYFMDPEAAQSSRDSLESELVGVGISIDYDTIPITIVFAYPDTPASEAGIQPGDQILSIDGVDIESDVPDDVSDMIRGEEGTDVTFEIRHAGDTESESITITRARIQLNPVSWAMMPGNVQWVRLDNFSTGAADHIRDALEAGNELGAEGVILDLRGNSGGWIDEAIAVASELEPNRSVVYQSESDDGDIDEFTTTKRNGEWQEGPLVVLIDGNTASCGELLAATLNDNERGPLVGQTTLGLGTSVYFYDLEDGSAIALSEFLWLTPDGDVMLNEGIAPDIEIENEPGILMSLPFLFEDNELSRSDIVDLEDDQLLTAYEEIQDIIADDN